MFDLTTLERQVAIGVGLYSDYYYYTCIILLIVSNINMYVWPSFCSIFFPFCLFSELTPANKYEQSSWLVVTISWSIKPTNQPTGILCPGKRLIYDE